MANWTEVYERAEDNHLKMMEDLLAEMERETSLDTTGTTTMSKEEKPQG